MVNRVCIHISTFWAKPLALNTLAALSCLTPLCWVLLAHEWILSCPSFLLTCILLKLPRTFNKLYSYDSNANQRNQTKKTCQKKSLLQRIQEKHTLLLLNTLKTLKRISSELRWHLKQENFLVPHKLYRVGFWLVFSLKNEARILTFGDDGLICYKQKVSHLEHLENLDPKNFHFKCWGVNEAAKTWQAKSLRREKLGGVW